MLGGSACLKNMRKFDFLWSTYSIEFNHRWHRPKTHCAEVLSLVQWTKTTQSNARVQYMHLGWEIWAPWCPMPPTCEGIFNIEHWQRQWQLVWTLWSSCTIGDQWWIQLPEASGSTKSALEQDAVTYKRILDEERWAYGCHHEDLTIEEIKSRRPKQITTHILWRLHRLDVFGKQSTKVVQQHAVLSFVGCEYCFLLHCWRTAEQREWKEVHRVIGCSRYMTPAK